MGLVLLWLARRFSERLKNADLFLIYVCLYSVGRFLIETLLLDPATFLIAGSIRGNLFVSGVLALGFALILFLQHSRSFHRRPQQDS